MCPNHYGNESHNQGSQFWNIRLFKENFIRVSACLMVQFYNLNTKFPRHGILWVSTTKRSSVCLNLSKIFVMSLDLYP